MSPVTSTTIAIVVMRGFRAILVVSMRVSMMSQREYVLQMPPSLARGCSAVQCRTSRSRQSIGGGSRTVWPRQPEGAVSWFSQRYARGTSPLARMPAASVRPTYRQCHGS